MCATCGCSENNHVTVTNPATGEQMILSHDEAHMLGVAHEHAPEPARKMKWKEALKQGFLHSLPHPHPHDHSHDSSKQTEAPTTAEERFGITSFVYKRRLPFHPGRFSMFLQGLGKLSVKGISEIAGGEKTVDGTDNAALKVAKKSLLRSKGFVWMGTSKTAAYFISHAGQYLELMVLGRWWADINQAEWPKGSEEEITVDFQGEQGELFN